MRIGIAIATYNTAAYLMQCLRSIEKQVTEHEIYVCVVNDASTDSTERFLKAYKEFYHTRIAITQFDYFSFEKNSGHCAKPYNYAFDYLFNKCNCNAVWKVDSDDFLGVVDAVDRMVTKINEGFDWVNCHALAFGEREFEMTCNPKATLEDFRTANQLTSFGMWSKRAWNRLIGFDETMKYEDWEMWIRGLRAGLTYGVVTEPIYRYRLHENNLHKKTGTTHQENLNKILQKHYGQT